MPQPSIAFPPLDDSAGEWAPILRSPIASYDVSLDDVVQFVQLPNERLDTHRNLRDRGPTWSSVLALEGRP